MTFNVYTQGGGGGGGSYTGGNGIDVAGGVITNTGTLIQPAASGTNSGEGIMLRAGAPGAYPGLAGGVYGYGASVTQPGTPDVQAGGPVNFYGGNNTITDTAGSGNGGLMAFSGGAATNASVYAGGASFVGDGGEIEGQTVANGGGMLFQGGRAAGATTNTGGGVYFGGGYGDQIGGNIGFYGGTGGTQGGNIVLDPGAGATNGVVLISTIGTVDPAVLGAVWQKSVATVGYVLMRSQG